MASITDLMGLFFKTSTEVAISEGRGFALQTFDSAFGATAEKDMCLETGDAIIALNSISLQTDSTEMFVEVFEDADWTGGTVFTATQLNRNFVGVPTTLKDAKEDPTITVPGNLILSFPLLGTSGQGNKAVVSASSGSDSLLIAKRNTKYCIRVRNSGELGRMSFSASFGKS